MLPTRRTPFGAPFEAKVSVKARRMAIYVSMSSGFCRVSKSAALPTRTFQICMLRVCFAGVDLPFANPDFDRMFQTIVD